MKNLVNAIPSGALFTEDGDINYRVLAYAIYSMKQDAGITVTYRMIADDLHEAGVEDEALIEEVFEFLQSRQLKD